MFNKTTLRFSIIAYCENNPIGRIDLHGNAWFRIFVAILICVVTVVAVAATVGHIASGISSLVNLDFNKNNDTNAIVPDQEKIKMKFGASTFADSGCGAAAVHNAIILAGGKSQLSDVVQYLVASNATLGFFGAYYTSMRIYLSRQGYNAKRYLFGLKGNIDSKIKSCSHKIGILAYQHSSGGHYVAVQYANNQFNVYNPNLQLNSIDGWIKQKHYKSLCLITI